MLTLQDRAVRFTELYYAKRTQTPTPAEIVETYRAILEELEKE